MSTFRSRGNVRCWRCAAVAPVPPAADHVSLEQIRLASPVCPKIRYDRDGMNSGAGVGAASGFALTFSAWLRIPTVVKHFATTTSKTCCWRMLSARLKRAMRFRPCV